MELINNENENEIINNTEIKRTRGRPKKEEEDKKKRPEHYDINYYHSSKYSNKIKCDICNSDVTFAKLKRHQKTVLCYHRSLINEIHRHNINNL